MNLDLLTGLEGLQVWTPWLLNEVLLLDQKGKTAWTNPIRWDWIKSVNGGQSTTAKAQVGLVDKLRFA